MRPSVAFSPTTPVQDAGQRIEPPPSVPIASGAMPAASAALAPPLEPPGVRSRFQGLRVTPCSGLSVSTLWANSGRLVVPIGIAPAAFTRAVTVASRSGTTSTDGERAVAHRHAADRDIVLDGDRHAVQRAQRVAAHHRGLGGAGRVHGLLRPQHGEDVEHRLQALGARQHGASRPRPARPRVARSGRRAASPR